MKRARIAMFVAGSLAAFVWSTADYAFAEDMPIKQIMGENFAGLQQILTALIDSHYETVPHQLDVIQDHAAQLARAVPDNAKDERERFLGYAYNLQAHAADLETIIGVLMEHDKSNPTGTLPTDQLREAAAAHYGGMVTMCVACHNRFRQRAIP